MKTAEARAEYFPSIDSQERNLPHRESYRPDIWHYIEYESRLKNTPFDLQKEWASFTKVYKTGLAEGLSSPEAALRAYSGVEINIRSFMREFGEQALVLPHLLAEKDGQMVNSFDGKPLLSRITRNERGGFVLFASEQIQNFFQIHKEPGSLAVFTSPDGWTGILGTDGKPILGKDGRPFRYKTSETFIFWRDKGGKLNGVTIVTDMKRDQHKSLLASFGVNDNLDAESEEEEVTNIVSHPGFAVSIAGKLNTPFDIARKIIEIRGTKNIRIEQMDSSIEYKSVGDIFRDLNRLDQLLLFNEKGEEYLKGLKQMVETNANYLEDPRIQLWVIRGIEDVVLKLTRQIRKKSTGQEIIFNQAVLSQKSRIDLGGSDDFSEEVKFLANRVGCAPGSSRRVFLSAQEGVFQMENAMLGVKENSRKCVICGEVNPCLERCAKCNGEIEAA